MTARLSLFTSAFLIASTLAAPLHAGRQDDLRRAEAALEASRMEEEALATEAKKIAADLTVTKKKLVSLSRTLQKNEHEAGKATKELKKIEAQIKEKNASLADRQQQLRAMIDASVRLSRMPPEAAVMMPELSGDAMEAARALRVMTQSIQTISATLSEELGALELLREKAKKQRESLAGMNKKLGRDRAEMQQLLKTRERMYASAEQEHQEVATRSRKLAKKASSIKDLLVSLEKMKLEKMKKDNLAEKTLAITKTSAKINILPPTNRVSGSKGQLRPFTRAKGRIRPPAAGTLLRSYGEKGGGVEKSKGFTIATPEGATVSAPYDGEVVFTGPFMAYGNIVILRHSNGFHSLIAGMNNIRASTGEFLLEGEPIGAMSNQPSGRELYVELREHNQPIDPATWFAGIH